MKRGKRTSRCRRGSRKASPNITCHMYMANLQRYRGTNTHPSRVQGTPKKHIRCQTDAFTTQSYSVWWRLLHIHLAPAYPRLSFISEVIDLLQLACSIRCFLQLRLGPPMVAKGIKGWNVSIAEATQHFHASACQVEQRSCPGVRPNLSHATLQCCLQSIIILNYPNLRPVGPFILKATSLPESILWHCKVRECTMHVRVSQLLCQIFRTCLGTLVGAGPEGFAVFSTK
jgi:hypothetical protein